MTLVITLRFLATPHLSEISAPQYPEWPPHPDRLFQALVATAAEICADMGVLHHLETAPEMRFSEAMATSPVTGFVPTNFRADHMGNAKFWPTAHPEDPNVTYIWREAPAHACSALSPIVENLTHVGRTASLVVAQVDMNSMTEANWVPHDRGDLLLRVPNVGRLDDLVGAYKHGRRSSPANMVGYRNITDVTPRGPWDELLLLRVKDTVVPQRTAQLAENLRKAVMAKSGSRISEIVHGHAGPRHAAWVALPDVGHAHADGHVLGLGVWLPKETSLAERGQVGVPLSRVHNLRLGLRDIRVSLPDRDLHGLRESTWARPATTWATVTPIVLDRYPRRKLSAERIVSDSVEQLGLPAPTHVELDHYSPVKGTPASPGFRLRRPGRLYRHAVVTFASPVRGPLIIGAERYFGLGLCRPFRDAQ